MWCRTSEKEKSLICAWLLPFKSLWVDYPVEFFSWQIGGRTEAQAPVSQHSIFRQSIYKLFKHITNLTIHLYSEFWISKSALEWAWSFPRRYTRRSRLLERILDPRWCWAQRNSGRWANNKRIYGVGAAEEAEDEGPSRRRVGRKCVQRESLQEWAKQWKGHRRHPQEKKVVSQKKPTMSIQISLFVAVAAAAAAAAAVAIVVAKGHGTHNTCGGKIVADSLDSIPKCLAISPAPQLTSSSLLIVDRIGKWPL